MGLRRWFRWMLLGRRDGFRSRVRGRLGWFTWVDRARRKPAPPPPVKAPMAQAPAGFVAVLQADALKPGEITEVIVGDMALAVANVDGVFFAISNICAHAGGPVGDGVLEGTTVTCPYHGWSYDVRSGACFVNTDLSLDAYEVQMVEGTVCVRL